MQSVKQFNKIFNEYVNQIDTITLMSSSCYFCGIILVLFVSILISNSVTTPIRPLQRAMKAVELGNAEIRVAIQSTNEVGMLSRSFIRLLERINDLLSSITQIEGKKREAQLSKMNPHFCITHWNPFV